MAHLPDPSSAAGAFLEYLRLKEKRFRENPYYVMEVYRRYKRYGHGQPAPEWVQREIDEWFGEKLDDPEKPMETIMGLSGRGIGKRPAIHDLREWSRTIELFLEMARLRYLGVTSIEKAAEIVCRLAGKRNSITPERLARLYGEWPERDAAKHYIQIQLRQWPEDRLSQYVKKIPSDLVPQHLERLYTLPSKK